jgi:hypothetical protein
MIWRSAEYQMKLINVVVLMCAVFIANAGFAQNFPSAREIENALLNGLGQGQIDLPEETWRKLEALHDAPAEPRVVPDILIEVLTARSRLGGVVVLVSDNHVLEVQDHAEAIISFFYREHEGLRNEALQNWRARNRLSAVGWPVHWSEQKLRACRAATWLVVAAAIVWYPLSR